MKKKILFLEDNLEELDRGANELKRNNYEVYKASSTDKAQDLLDGIGPTTFDCLVVDLNISNEYLPIDLIPLTHSGSLTGWVWLYYIVRLKCTNCPKIILYSEFISELQDEMANADENAISYFDTVVLISKTQAVNGTKELVVVVNKLFESKRVRFRAIRA